MAKYIIKIRNNIGYTYFVGNGGTYRFQYEKYAVIVENSREAKQYSSLKRAEIAYEKLNKSCVNIYGDVEFVEV